MPRRPQWSVYRKLIDRKGHGISEEVALDVDAAEADIGRRFVVICHRGAGAWRDFRRGLVDGPRIDNEVISEN